jgi:hypothetical protein
LYLKEGRDSAPPAFLAVNCELQLLLDDTPCPMKGACMEAVFVRWISAFEPTSLSCLLLRDLNCACWVARIASHSTWSSTEFHERYCRQKQTTRNY